MERKTGRNWWCVVVAMVLFDLSASYVSAAVVIPWVIVSNPGNKADLNGFGPGAVSYTYLIDKYDVTNVQFAEFLNAVDKRGLNAVGLFDTRMSNYPGHVDWTGGIDLNPAADNGSKYSVKSGQGNLPVVWVSWNSAARFANWLNNGQGDATTESGAYDMTQAMPSRLANAGVFLPSENEWYKAAYSDPTKGGSNKYWAYAGRSDNFPVSQPPPGGPNGANFVDSPSGRYALTGSSFRDDNLVYLTEVGAYVNSPSYYGTFDQNGDVSQWNESSSLTAHGLRGGAWDTTGFNLASNVSSTRTDPLHDLGFRVAGLPEPAPGYVVLMLAGLACQRGRARRSPKSPCTP